MRTWICFSTNNYVLVSSVPRTHLPGYRPIASGPVGSVRKFHWVDKEKPSLLSATDRNGSRMLVYASQSVPKAVAFLLSVHGGVALSGGRVILFILG